MKCCLYTEHIITRKMNLVATLFAVLCVTGLSQHKADPTDGFTQLPLTLLNFEVQKPYDVLVTQRYSYINGVHRFWVYSTDKPFQYGSTTLPRTEIRIRGYDYSSGVWQFEGRVYVPQGTSGASVMQVFGADPPYSITMQLRVYDGSLTYIKTPVLVSNMYGQWLKVNVIHDVNAGNVKVYINNVFKYQHSDNGGSSHYFKFGVYAQVGESYYMESRWKGIKVLRK